MYCGNCGHPNEDGAKFCENCGSKLVNTPAKEDKKDQEDTQKLKPVKDEYKRPEEAYRNNRDYEKKVDERPLAYSKENAQNVNQRDPKSSFDIKKVLIIVLVVISLAALIVWAKNFLLVDKEDSTATVTTSEALSSEEDVDYDKKLSDAKNLIENGDYEGAINILKAIPDSDKKAYDKAQNLLAQTEERMVDQLVEVFNSGDYEKAEKLSSRYMELLPKSNDIAVVNDRSKEELKKQEEENNKEKSVEERKADLSKNYDMNNIIYYDLWDKNGNPSYVEFYRPEDFIGKDLTVDISAGQLKEAPDINSARIGQVERGEVVHPTKAQSDGTRYWLYIGKGWVSSKLITGEFHKE